MLLKIALILALAAKGSSDCPRWRNKDVCFLKPRDDPGMFTFGYYYDVTYGRCASYVFGNSGTRDENRFSTEAECNEVCRSEVPSFCFENPSVKPKEGASSKKWKYLVDYGRCVEIQWNGAIESCQNIFDSSHECERVCKIPDAGPCAKGIKSGCTPTQTKWYWFNYTSLTCQEMKKDECPNGEGNAFRSFYECNRRCGRFVQDKCSMPIQNISRCMYLETAYGYNTVTKRCEQIMGCHDGGNIFDTAKQCWMTCSKNPPSRCVQKPDVSSWPGAFHRYYYDIDKNECVYKSQLGKGSVSGKTNIFYSFKDCQEACKAIHVPQEEY